MSLIQAQGLGVRIGARQILRDVNLSVRKREIVTVVGPNGSGKTTLLKTFMMEMVHTYTDFVPVLMPVIEMAPVLDACNRHEGESVVVAFIQRKYPQHAHILLQMVLMRRAVFLIDGIDESGPYRGAGEELRPPGGTSYYNSREAVVVCGIAVGGLSAPP